MTFVLGMRAEFDASAVGKGVATVRTQFDTLGNEARAAGVAMDTAFERTAAGANAASFQARNLQFQMIDIAQTIPLAFQAPLYALQNVAMQGAQIAQIYGPGEGGAARGFREAGAMALGVVRTLAPIAALVAAGAGAWKLFTHEVDQAAGATRRLANDAASYSAVQGQIDALARVQKAYRDAIEDTANAQLIASNGIVASTEREFEAKKSLLELELKRQRAAVETQRIDLVNAERQYRKLLTDTAAMSDHSPVARGFSDPRIGSVPFVRSPDAAAAVETLMSVADNSELGDQIRTMRAELELTEVAAERLADMLGTTFRTVDSGMKDTKKPGASERFLDRYRRTQDEDLARLRLEARLIGATTAEREKANALLEAEIAIKRGKLAIDSDAAQEIRRQQLAMADLRLEITRQAGAWTMVRDAGMASIDGITESLRSGDLAGALERIGDQLLDTLASLTIANPLKNALYGENLPTLSDVNGQGGFLSMLFGGGSGGSAGTGSGWNGLRQVTTGNSASGGGFWGALTSLFGFDTGGWTGDGNPRRVAGYVHEEEFVVKAGPARKFRPMLEAINRGSDPGHAEGGMVGSSYASSSPSASGGGPRGGGNMYVKIEDHAGVAIDTRREQTPDGDEMLAVMIDRVDGAIADGAFDSSFGRYSGGNVRGTRR